MRKSIGGYGTIEYQRIRVGDEECLMRFVIKDVAFHLLCLVQTNIGRIAYDDIPAHASLRWM